MKKILKHATNDILQGYSNKQAQALLKHMLGPLELEALKQRYKTFQYDINGTSIPITAGTCKQLLIFTRNKINFFSELMQQESFNQKISLSIPKLLDDPKVILSLPPHLRNILIERLDCYNLFDVLQIGQKQLSQTPRLGKESLKTLDKLFKEHNCEHLFI